MSDTLKRGLPVFEHNLLIAAMPTEIRKRFAPKMRTVELTKGLILQNPGQTIKTVYFPLTCLISVTVTMSEGRTCEAGVVGSREMVGINAFMGGSETTQTQYVAQVPGLAVRMPASVLLDEWKQNESLRNVLLKYTQAYIGQLSQNVACNRLHDVHQRLARWLLESRERIQSDELRLTHQFLGEMLGVRRATVSELARPFRDSGAIEWGRNSIQIIDVEKLKQTSCECYEVIRNESDRLLGKR
jgi:CRP-like cAMP-binding protein